VISTERGFCFVIYDVGDEESEGVDMKVLDEYSGKG